jgi:hypothetical protein
MRMNIVAFEDVLSRVEFKLTKAHTRLRRPICPRERLCIGIRFLATGKLHYPSCNAFSTCCCIFCIDKQTIDSGVGAAWMALHAEYITAIKFHHKRVGLCYYNI